MINRFNFEENLHTTYSVTGLFSMSGIGNAFVQDATGVFYYDVNKWNREFNKRLYSATNSGEVLEFLPFGSSGRA